MTLVATRLIRVTGDCRRDELPLFRALLFERPVDFFADDWRVDDLVAVDLDRPELAEREPLELPELRELPLLFVRVAPARLVVERAEAPRDPPPDPLRDFLPDDFDPAAMSRSSKKVRSTAAQDSGAAKRPVIRARERPVSGRDT